MSTEKVCLKRKSCAEKDGSVSPVQKAPTKVPKSDWKLTDTEVEMLISEVQSRPSLWNDNHNDFKNTAITKKLWNEIGSSINVPGEETKKKWKNLKDKFRKLLQQPNPKASESSSHKWKFFKCMQFTRDIVLPIRMVGNPSQTEEAEDFVSLETYHHGSTHDCAVVTMSHPCVLQSTPQPGAPTKEIAKALPPNSRKTNGSRFPRTHRSKTNSNNDKNEMEKKLMELEERKINAILSMQAPKEKGDDYHFLVSLLPFITGLGPMEKLELRSQIQNSVLGAFRKHEARGGAMHKTIPEVAGFVSDESSSPCVGLQPETAMFLSPDTHQSTSTSSGIMESVPGELDPVAIAKYEPRQHAASNCEVNIGDFDSVYVKEEDLAGGDLGHNQEGVGDLRTGCDGFGK